MVFFALLPLLILAGNVANPLAMLVLGLFMVYFVYTDRHDSIILVFVLILILGDSRQGWLQFSKPLRVEMLVIMTLVTFSEIWRGRYRVSTYFLAFFPFLVIASIALAFSPFLDVGINKTISFSMLYFVFLHYVTDKFSRYGMRFFGDLVLLCHFVLLIGLVLLPLFPNMVSYGGMRFNGMLGNPNGMGMFVTFVTPMTVYYFHVQKGISRRYIVLIWFLIVISLALCSSRNAIFSFIIFLGVYNGLKGTGFWRLIFTMVVVPFGLLLLLSIDIESMVYSLGLEKYFRVKDFESGSGRIFAWRHAWNLIVERPIIGCGFACEEYNFLHKTTYELWSTGHQGGVHNSYLAFIVNTGFVGFSLYMGFLGNIFRKIRNYRFLVPFLASVSFSAMFESWLFSSLSAYHILFLVMVFQLFADRYLPVQRRAL